jgi:hypothetical protein
MLRHLLFSLHSNAQIYLTQIKSSPTVLEVHKQNAESSYSINVFHQNIRGLRSKSNELIHYCEIDNTNPLILCLSEHHMVEQELLHLMMNGYLSY